MSVDIAQQPRRKRVSPKAAQADEGKAGPELSALRSRQILAALSALRDGDFSVRLPNSWEGVDGQIAAAFNQITAQEARIGTEVARLSATVGKEGRLKHRMSLPGSAAASVAGEATVLVLRTRVVPPHALRLSRNPLSMISMTSRLICRKYHFSRQVSRVASYLVNLQTSQLTNYNLRSKCI